MGPFITVLSIESMRVESRVEFCGEVGQGFYRSSKKTCIPSGVAITLVSMVFSDIVESKSGLVAQQSPL